MNIFSYTALTAYADVDLKTNVDLSAIDRLNETLKSLADNLAKVAGATKTVKGDTKTLDDTLGKLADATKNLNDSTKVLRDFPGQVSQIVKELKTLQTAFTSTGQASQETSKKVDEAGQRILERNKNLVNFFRDQLPSDAPTNNPMIKSKLIVILSLSSP